MDAINSKFIIHNSVWKNLVLTLITAPFFLAPAILASSTFLEDIQRDKVLFFSYALFGFGAILFSYRLFDRRIRVRVCEAGIQDLRTRYGIIQWQDISSYRFWSVKGIDFLRLNLYDPEKWIERAGIFRKLIARAMGPKRFYISVSFQNMDVDISALDKYMSTKISRNT